MDNDNQSDSSVNFHLSDSEADNNAPKESKRKRKHYKQIFEFESFTLAKERLNEPISDRIYRFRCTRKTTEGEKDFYHCQGN